MSAPANGRAPSSWRPISARPSSTDLRELLLSEGLAKFKIPEQIVIWDALPKNDAGKILKHQIRATLTEVGGLKCR